ncbi:Uncharacterized protein dnl_14670 [Desulfonema limicola]|uniref:Uncharacterized protein n=1 Tax=Desulfonema limicola TaxID=45656 RepID=A0A975GFF6_9BACT|nr:hypothetical protein [Desulfonema limicola]QTA79212.1 Uncharacterized protein dnl_14670 [Desulfonema limicola]
MRKFSGLSEIYLVFFVEEIDDDNRTRYESDYSDKVAGTTVMPIFAETGF